MNDEDLMLYLWEIEEQCRYAKKAWGDAQTNDYDLQWYSIQAFLVAIANVSKFLWPIKKRSIERGNQLRKILGVKDTHPFKSRLMRDSFEHSDERLDSWLASREQGLHLGRVTIQGRHGTHGGSHYVRYFERDTGILTFFGENYDLKQIAHESEKLYEKSLKVTTDWTRSPNRAKHPQSVNREESENV